MARSSASPSEAPLSRWIPTTPVAAVAAPKTPLPPQRMQPGGLRLGASACLASPWASSRTVSGDAGACEGASEDGGGGQLVNPQLQESRHWCPPHQCPTLAALPYRHRTRLLGLHPR